MLYRLEIMPPGRVDSEPLEVFESSSPFIHFASRDLIEPISWSGARDNDFYQVVGVVHRLQHRGEELVHTLRIHTRRTLKTSGVIHDLMR